MIGSDQAANRKTSTCLSLPASDSASPLIITMNRTMSPRVCGSAGVAELYPRVERVRVESTCSPKLSPDGGRPR